MHIKLIALDIDGTLTNDQKEITPATRQALIQAQQQGIRLVIASARPSPGLHQVRDILRMQEYGGLLMSYNGGRIVDAVTDKPLYETVMDQEETRDILRFLETLPVTVILDDGKQFYVTDRSGYKVEYECRNNQMTCTEVENLAQFLHFAPVKLLMSVDPSCISEIQKKIAAYLPTQLTVVQTAAFYLEIIPRSIHKGQGLCDICRLMQIDLSETMAFGDSENDISMLQAAGVGAAMANAQEEVKAAADVVTRGNNEDGIAWLLQKYGIFTFC